MKGSNDCALHHIPERDFSPHSLEGLYSGIWVEVTIGGHDYNHRYFTHQHERQEGRYNFGSAY